MCQHFSGHKIKSPFGLVHRPLGSGYRWLNDDADDLKDFNIIEDRILGLLTTLERFQIHIQFWLCESSREVSFNV